MKGRRPGVKGHSDTAIYPPMSRTAKDNTRHQRTREAKFNFLALKANGRRWQRTLEVKYFIYTHIANVNFWTMKARQCQRTLIWTLKNKRLPISKDNESQIQANVNFWTLKSRQGQRTSRVKFNSMSKDTEPPV